MADRRPNLVVFLADDLGYGDLSCLNAAGRIATPHHDRLAAEGRCFTDAHSNSAVCTPTRYGLLTGRYCWRGALKSGVLYGFDDPLIEPGRMTVASLLHHHGYHTACIGKWHLGLGWQRRSAAKEDLDYGRPLVAGPHTVGFDRSFIIPASLDMAPYCYLEDGSTVEAPSRDIPASELPAMWRGGPCAPGFVHGTCLLELTTRAEAFLAEHARHRPEDPFFLYFPTPSPHTPHVPREPFRGASGVGTYGDYVVEHDWALGRILGTLDRLGLADDTMVIATSDNGCPMARLGLVEAFGHRSNGQRRGQKSDAWEGGHRVPFIARWPGRIPAGTRCDDLLCLTDLLATAAAMVGADLPDDAGEDSANQLAAMLDEPRAPARDDLIEHSITGAFAITRGGWKLIEARGSGGWSLPEAQVPPDAPPGQLYYLPDDPEEQHNLYTAEPARVAELGELLARRRT